MPDEPRDVVYGLSSETWDDMVRREFARPPDRLLQHLLGSPRVGRLLVVNPWRSAVSQLKRRVGPHRDSPFVDAPSARLLRPIRWRRGDSPDLRRLTRSYRTYGSLVDLVARRRGLHDPVLITYNPLLAAFGGHRDFSAVTYVGRDDWTAYHGAKHLQPAFEQAYAAIRERAIRVSTVSEELMGRVAPRAAHEVVPNGVDPGVWTRAAPTPALIMTLPRPVAVYTGTVDERLSVEAVRSLSSALPGGTVLLIGPHATPTARTLEQLPNVMLLASMKQSALAAYVAAADVCVLPHVDSPLTRAMSPLKIYEYLAAGRPVVATDLPPVRNIDPSIVLCADGPGFGSAALAAIERGPLTEAHRLDFIAQNSWDARCARILDLALG